jgi:hypothetical protein
MDNLSKLILNNAFKFAYPIGFVGAIMYSIMSIISVDFFSAFFNKGIIVFLNIYVGICGYIAFCTFFKIQVEIGDTVFNFDNIYISYDEFNAPYSIDPGETQISLTG